MAGGAMAQFSCLVGKGRSYYRPHQLFPNRLSSADGSAVISVLSMGSAVICLVYELSSLPVCNIGTFYTLGLISSAFWSFSLSFSHYTNCQVISPTHLV